MPRLTPEEMDEASKELFPKKELICYKLKVIADAIIEQQRYGQVCSANLKALKEISKEEEE